VYLELLATQETNEFLQSLKRLIARRGRPQKIYSDNGKTFVAAAKWLKQIMKDERLHDWLARHEIKWQFNTSRAPWWGGQFERIVGLVKQALYKAGGSTLLTWDTLQDLLLDVEVALNNRPLSYVEDDLQLPVLTPNSLMFHRPNQIPTQDYRDIEEADLRKTAKQCNDSCNLSHNAIARQVA
jgi:transposase InsO family protein